jgi:LmbE family N-acetylglucosaminyl deacetylase
MGMTMLANNFLDAAQRLPRADLTDLLGDGGAVIVAPHADDETLGCGSLIARAAADGREVRIIFVSDSVGSHPNSRAYPPDRLRALRESEALAAALELGLCPSHIAFLQLPDRHVPCDGAEASRAADVIAERARQVRAAALFVTWRHDPHCDHRASYAIARMAQRRYDDLRLFEYSIWGHALPDDYEAREEVRGWRFDGAAQRARKRAAMACHQSQMAGLIDDDPSGFRLDLLHVSRLLENDEVFLEIAP